MNCQEWIEDLKINNKLLDEKKQQTDYKIKYVVEYVKLWMLVNLNREEITNINFIDCMCNAGIYKDGDLCTAVEVLSLFISYAQDHQEKSFNLFINDHDQEKIEIFKIIAEKILNNKIMPNVKILISNLDVNIYLAKYEHFENKLKYGAATILYVDPYDFGTVKIYKLTDFISKFYCEVVFNFFISDYVRNGIDKRIRECIGQENIENKEDLISYIVRSVKVGKMKFVFSYQFRTAKNRELYQIIFVTPSQKGLIKLKEALWKVFSGKFYHRNKETNPMQLSLIPEDDDRNYLLCIHAKDAKSLLFKSYSGKTVLYSDLERFLIENTMMKDSDFLESVIKPLIREGKLKKCGNVKNKNNYKNDEYIFRSEL